MPVDPLRAYDRPVRDDAAVPAHEAGPESVACPGCGSAAGAIAGPSATRIHLCGECGLGFDPVACARAFDPVEPGGYADAGYDGWLGASRRRRHARFRLAWLGAIVPAPARLLEIGCGHGYFLDEASTAGYLAAGVEMAPASAERARHVASAQVICERFEQADVPEAAVDVVCAWRTLEYAAAPGPFLERVRSVLVPGGAFTLETVNSQLRRPSPRFAGRSGDGSQDPRLFFSPVAMRIALEAAGLEVLACETIFEEALVSSAEPTEGSGRFSRMALTHPVRGEFIRAVARRPR